MTLATADRAALAALEVRINALLPEAYQDCYDEVQPTSMGSAGLRFDAEGKVAWNQMWGSFCDLAMAGGPPHKGTLLEPASASDIDAQPRRYRAVVDEICRGITMVTDLSAERSPNPGWVRVECLGEGMAQWLLRAIVMENVSARADGEALDVPAGPHFRVEKEIKNVVTVMAKTCHYWMEHTSYGQRRAIAHLLEAVNRKTPLVEPPASSAGPRRDGQHEAFTRMAEAIRLETGLGASNLRYAGWIGVECPSVRAAIWMMRTMVVSNVLSRREGTVLFVPIDPVHDPGGDRVVNILARTRRLALFKGVH